MSDALNQILVACVPVLCLLITAGGAYAVALLRRETTKIEKQLDNETAAKYMTMASEAVAQAVAFTSQTFVDTLKKQGAFTKEKQAEAFKKSKEKTLEILSDTAVAALMKIYGDLDAWLDTKIEQVCRETKLLSDKEKADSAATTAAATAATIATAAVQQITAAEGPLPAADPDDK